jgi:hypothetical protein
MPYKLRKAPKKPLYWVVDSTGDKYSREPIPLERAKKQMIALHINTKSGGVDPKLFPPLHSSQMWAKPDPITWYNDLSKALAEARAKYEEAKKFNETNPSFENAHKVTEAVNKIGPIHDAIRKVYPEYQAAIKARDMKGGFSISEYTTSLVRPKYTTATQKWVKANENQTISAMVIRRAPIASALNTAFELITAGKWYSGMKEAGYDQMYHLGVVITTENGKSSILEKLSSLNFSDTITTVPKTEYRKVSVPAGLTVGMMLDKTYDFMGRDQYFKYDAFQNNCQTFIYSLLKSNGLGTQADYDWLLQPLDVLLKKEPGFLPGVAKTITNIGAIWDTLFGGISQKKMKHIRKYLKGMGIPATRQNMDLAMSACDAEGVVF